MAICQGWLPGAPNILKWRVDDVQTASYSQYYEEVGLSSRNAVIITFQAPQVAHCGQKVPTRNRMGETPVDQGKAEPDIARPHSPDGRHMRKMSPLTISYIVPHEPAYTFKRSSNNNAAVSVRLLSRHNNPTRPPFVV